MSKSARHPTPAQQRTLDEYFRVFTRKNTKVSAPRAADGVIRMRAKAQAGTWEISINTDGEITYDCLTMPLFEGTGDDRAS